MTPNGGTTLNPESYFITSLSFSRKTFLKRKLFTIYILLYKFTPSHSGLTLPSRIMIPKKKKNLIAVVLNDNELDTFVLHIIFCNANFFY